MYIRINNITIFSGLSWFVTDMFWYWKFNTISFCIGIITMILTIWPIIDKKSNTNSTFILLNIWLWINMIALAKDVFIIEENIIQYLDYTAGLLLAASVGLILPMLKEKQKWRNFKRL